MNDRVKLIPDISLSMPRFQNEAEGFARDMAQYSAETIAEMLGCSQQIAAQNRLRYMRFFEDSAKLPAILAYHGQAYKHLKAETLTVDDLNVAQGKLWITSFLYGLLRPLNCTLVRYLLPTLMSLSKRIMLIIKVFALRKRADSFCSLSVPSLVFGL